MFTKLLHYYYYLLVYGRPQKSKDVLRPYGRHELKKNQTWYGLTALAVVGGMAIYLSFGLLYFQPKKINALQCGPVCLDRDCLGLDFKLPPPPPKGPLSFGTVHLLDLRIPKPAPKIKKIHIGRSEDPLILDPNGPDISILSDTYALPDLGSPSVKPLTYDLPPHFALPEIEFVYEPDDAAYELICGCPELDERSFPYDVSFLDKIQKDVDQKPVPINLSEIIRKISYPSICREAGILGKVVIQIIIDKHGRYATHEVVKSVHPLLDKEIEKHIGELLFTPAIKDGLPVFYKIQIPFNFHPID